VHDTLLILFIAIAALAIALQAGVLFALYKAVVQSSARMEAIATRIEQQTTPVLATAHAILDDARPKVAEITSNLAASTATVRAHVSQVAEATGEIVERARMQAARLDDMISSTADKIENTTEFLQNSVLGPVRRVQGIVQALSAGLSFFRNARNRSQARQAARAPEDEEMFI